MSPLVEELMQQGADHFKYMSLKTAHMEQKTAQKHSPLRVWFNK